MSRMPTDEDWSELELKRELLIVTKTVEAVLRAPPDQRLAPEELRIERERLSVRGGIPITFGLPCRDKAYNSTSRCRGTDHEAIECYHNGDKGVVRTYSDG